jgi:hypothetical protein
VGVGSFLFTPFPAPAWAVVASTFVLGAGLGLISTPLVVGIQSTVDTGSRGTATGSLMFCRFLGQSLGAAVFGAIVNGTLQARLDAAPASLAGSLPSTVDGIEPAILAGGLPGAGLDYLRAAMSAATDHLYVGLTAVAVLAFAVLLIAPRRFPLLDQQREPDLADAPGAA